MPGLVTVTLPLFPWQVMKHGFGVRDVRYF